MTSKQIARYNPNRDLKAPVKPRNVTIEQLLAAGCHIGHNKSSCHPAMKPFIAGLHDKLHIINLDYTIAHLRRACTVVREVAFRHGVILVIGTRKGHKPILVKATERMGSCLLHRKWIPGTVTNSNNVLFRGYLTEVATPFKTVEASEGDKKVADGVTRSRMVWDHGKAEWVEANDDPHEFRDWKGELRLTYPNIADAEAKKLNLPDLIGDSEGTSLSRDIFKQARRRGDLAEWMAWEKFASIVQNVSNTLTEIIAVPEQTLPESLADFNIDPIAEYIPDHSDHWYARQLENENAEIRHRQKKSYETGDRTPIEMYELDKFLARHKYAGAVRGSYMSETRRNNIKEDGLQAYKGVTVFRDGSTKVGQRRFDRKGNAIIQYSDGSYMMDNRLYDHDGKRYDAQSDSLVFSDGSALKFVGENKDKLAVLIGDKVFDVTSTVVGSSQKREILEKAADLLQQESGNASPSVSREEDFITQFLGAPQGLVSYPIIGEKAIEKEKAEEFGEDEYIGMRGDEMLDISDKVDAVALDELLQKSVRLNEQQEDLEDVQKPDPEPETPFDNMFKKSTATLRPDLIILLNPRENRLALREAANNQIPTIGITDTDCDPRSVTYSIPSNDDSLRSVEYLIGVLSRAGEEGLIHRNRYAKQLQFLEERAQRLLRESRLDYEILHAGEDTPVRANSDRTVGSVVNQYCQWYNLDPKKTELSTLQKIVGQHIVMSQNEIKRLNKDTKGWSMQDFLDHVKTSTQFPGVPSGVLEEMAQTQLTQSRQAWAEARKTMDRRERGISPEYMGPSREFNRVNT
jgi:ribosomal protein S2